RCMRCNGRLEPVRKEVVLDELPLSVQNEQDEFRRCQECGQVYWRGSHFERLSAFVEGLLSAPGLD
ncbi:MAG: Mut7-C RNAse domain-containing protein, partial [Anaerolineales bacterium]